MKNKIPGQLTFDMSGIILDAGFDVKEVKSMTQPKLSPTALPPKPVSRRFNDPEQLELAFRQKQAKKVRKRHKYAYNDAISDEEEF